MFRPSARVRGGRAPRRCRHGRTDGAVGRRGAGRSIAVRFVSRKASMAPLGLLTVAAMLPPDWNLKLVDLNVTRLKDEDLRRADYVLIGAMLVQQASVREIVARCAALSLYGVTEDEVDAGEAREGGFRRVQQVAQHGEVGGDEAELADAAALDDGLVLREFRLHEASELRRRRRHGDF